MTDGNIKAARHDGLSDNLDEGAFSFSTDSYPAKPVAKIINFLQYFYGVRDVHGKGFKSSRGIYVLTTDLYHEQVNQTPFYCDLHIFDEEMNHLHTSSHLIEEDITQIMWSIDEIVSVAKVSDIAIEVGVSIKNVNLCQGTREDDYYGYASIMDTTDRDGRHHAECTIHPFVYNTTRPDDSIRPSLGTYGYTDYTYIIMSKDGTPKDTALEFSKAS